jgi:hypothetical protein
LVRWTDSEGVPIEEPLLSLSSSAKIWNYPPIVFETPRGFLNYDGQLVEKPYMLIEGHARRLALNALVHHDFALPSQPIFVITDNKSQP